MDGRMNNDDGRRDESGFSELPDNAWMPSPKTPTGEVFGSKWLVWGYNELEEIQRRVRLEAMTQHQNETHLWYRALTLYYVAQAGIWDLSEIPEDRKSARTVQMDLLGLGLSSAKVAIDTLLAGYYSPAYATIRHMLETVLQCFYLDAFPDRAYLWTTPSTAENIKRMGARRMRDKLLSRIRQFEPESDRQACRDYVEGAYQNWELLSTGAHPSGSGLSQVVWTDSGNTKRQVGGGYDRYMTLLGFDHGFYALGELLSVFETTGRVNGGWRQRLAHWHEDVSDFREDVKSDPVFVEAEAHLERLRAAQSESHQEGPQT